MRIIAFLLAFAAAAPAVAVERRYSVTDFDRVRVEGPYEVRLVTGASSAATATGDAAGIDRVSIDVQGRTLRVRPNRDVWGTAKGAPAGPVRIDLATRDLRSAMVIGSGSLGIDRARGLRIDLSVSGSGSLSLDAAEADNLNLGLLGSGRIAVAGKTKQLRATVQGSGDLDARSLQAEDVDLVVDTSGSVAVGATRTAKVRANGAGDTEILGKPSCTVSGPAAPYVMCGR